MQREDEEDDRSAHVDRAAEEDKPGTVIQSGEGTVVVSAHAAESRGPHFLKSTGKASAINLCKKPRNSQ